MATQDRIIDLERSYIPMDPNGFPETMHATGGEDAPEGRVPVICYDGYNFVPTQYGYASFFGINSKLDIADLASRCDDVFMIQTDTFVNILVALTEDGIWTKQGSTTGAWNHIITLAIPSGIDVHLNWSKAVIGNEIFLYRQEEEHIWRINSGNSFVPTQATPNFLNMEGQMGIFKAGGRLAFWDSDGSISWGNPDDPLDQTPNLTSGVGNTKFQQIHGKIVVVHQHGTGFVIYCTKSVVLVARGSDANFFWISEAVFTGNGISYREQACFGQPDTIHFAYTTFGFAKIENGKAEYVLPEVFSYLKEKKEPVYLKVLQGRYLFLEIISENLIYPVVSFSTGVVPESTLTWPSASYSIDHIEENIGQAFLAGQGYQEGMYLYNNHGFTQTTQATSSASVPIWEDHLSSAIAQSVIKAYQATGVSGRGSPDYFDGAAFANGGITKITSGSEFFIPAAARNMKLAAGFAATEFIEANTQDFYTKQDFLWLFEADFTTDWITAITRKAHLDISVTKAFATLPVAQTYTFGPYVDLSFFSEANKYYGIADKSAWLQRSLTRLIYIDIDVTYDTSGVQQLFVTNAVGLALPTNPASYKAPSGNVYGVGSIAAGVSSAGVCGACSFYYYTGFDAGGGAPSIMYSSTPTPSYSPLTSPKCCIVPLSFRLGSIGGTALTTAQAQSGGWATVGANPSIPELYGTVIQQFGVPRIRYATVDNCIYKELGFTKITGHGHYTLLGAFVQDNTTDETVDYIDQCTFSPIAAKQKNIFFNDIPVPSTGFSFPYPPQDVTIDSVTYSYPDQTLTLPAGTFLLQAGAIEPIYPTFSGAFVYDLQYKKWGKMAQEYKQLLDYSPINSEAGDKRIDGDIFAVFSGALLTDGSIALFDKYPLDSVMRFGKVGYYRHGFTDCEGIDLQLRNPGTGTLFIEGSLDGKNIEPAITQSQQFEETNVVTAGFSSSARWFNIGIQGTYDIKHLEFKGKRKGRR